MSTTAAPAMTEDEAREFHAAAAETSRKLTRMSAAELGRVAKAERAAHGIELLYGKPGREDLVSEVMDLRGFTVDRINQAIHVLHHDMVWPECPHCAAGGTVAAA